MSVNSDEVADALRKIASDETYNAITNSYNDPGAVMKDVGAPTNNMLLNALLGEQKRSADKLGQVCNKVDRLEDLLAKILISMNTLSERQETTNRLLSKQFLAYPESPSPMATTPSTYNTSASLGTKWYYQGNVLASKHKVCTCLILQLMEIVKLRMDQKLIYYPDSVDGNFTVVELAISQVVKFRSGVSSVTYKEKIEVPAFDNKSALYSSILPVIASTRMDTPTTLLESRLEDIFTPLARPLVEVVEWIIQRLRICEHILSPRQIDILQSIGKPLIKPGTVSELHIDESKLCPRGSNPVAARIAELKPEMKKKYIEHLMRGEPPMLAYAGAAGTGKV